MHRFRSAMIKNSVGKYLVTHSETRCHNSTCSHFKFDDLTLPWKSLSDKDQEWILNGIPGTFDVTWNFKTNQEAALKHYNPLFQDSFNGLKRNTKRK